MARSLVDPEHEIIRIMLYFSSILSLIGSLFIILTFLVFKRTRTFGTKLIFFLSISDFFASIAWLPWNTSDQLCNIQAIFLQFFELSSYCWTFCIAISLYQVLFLEQSEKKSQRWLPLYHILSWGLPLISVILCVIFNKFGK